MEPTLDIARNANNSRTLQEMGFLQRGAPVYLRGMREDVPPTAPRRPSSPASSPPLLWFLRPLALELHRSLVRPHSRSAPIPTVFFFALRSCTLAKLSPLLCMESLLADA
eukprot:2254848-Rhodomonas_salina.4